MAEPYRAQTNPGGSSALSGASAAEAGAAVGEALQQTGGTVSRIGEQQIAYKKERDRDAEIAATGVQLAGLQTELENGLVDLKANAPAGGAGVAETITKHVDDGSNALLAGIKDPRVRQIFAPRLAELKSRFVTDGHAFEAGARATKLATDYGDTADTLAVGQQNNPNVEGLHASLATLEAMTAPLNAPDAVKHKLLREAQGKVSYAYGQSLADKDPAQLLGDGKNGGMLAKISPWLDAEQVDRLRTRGQAELVRQQAVDRAAAARQDAADRDSWQTINARLGRGDYSVTDQELDAAKAAATRMNDHSMLDAIADRRDLRDTALATRSFTPAQFRDARLAIEAKDPAKRTPEEAMRLAHLKQLEPTAATAFNNDPIGWATSAGMKPPAIDWARPTEDQGRARAAFARSLNHSLNAPLAFLTPDEIRPFQQRLATGGAAGEVEVAQTMRAMFGAKDGTAALQQIDRSNGNLQILVNLDPNVMPKYRLGTDELGRNPKLYNPKVANAMIAERKDALPPELQQPLAIAARAIAAHELASSGITEPDEDQYKAAYFRGLEQAAGGTGSGGGIARWGSAAIWIPPEMPKANALQRLARATGPEIIAAHTNATGDGPGGAPYYADGTGKLHRYPDAAARTMLNQGRLESAAPGIYRVVLPDGHHVVNKNGDYWQFDVRKLKGR